MNFDEFKRRYMAKMETTGFVFSGDDEGFNDKMAEMYLALMIYAEFQTENAKKQHEEMKNEMEQRMKDNASKKAIYVPGGHH